MAITLTGKKKSQKNLVLIFFTSLVVLSIILYYQFFSKEEILPVETGSYTIKKINLDFGVLDTPLISKLEPFPSEPATPSQEELGRDNPFYPYETSSSNLK